jgi:hypothetical protein
MRPGRRRGSKVQTSGKPVSVTSLSITGSRHMQPSPRATQSAWYFDAHGAYNDTDFIDAPDWLPRGSMSANDLYRGAAGSTIALAGVLMRVGALS